MASFMLAEGRMEQEWEEIYQVHGGGVMPEPTAAKGEAVPSERAAAHGGRRPAMWCDVLLGCGAV